MLVETGLSVPLFVSQVKRKVFCTLCGVLDGAAYFYGMIAGDVSRCFTWPRVTGTPWFLHSYFGHFIAFSI
jgi:hypothetical protein|tara:strand:+ start:76 stop:288 length:213 start_codon:yes stop_codon:yes gene_type:complete